MKELEGKIHVLETKVKLLEETLEICKKAQLSDQMGKYIQSREKILNVVNLINSVSDKPVFDFDEEKGTLEKAQIEKVNIDGQIKSAIKKTENFSEKYLIDSKYFECEFEYEIESGMVSTGPKRLEKIDVLTPFVGKGLRITHYKCSDPKRAIIPQEINGIPVTSIGKYAFKESSFAEIILPDTIKAIFDGVFCWCDELKKINLPESLEYIGECLFEDCDALKEISFPDSIDNIPCECMGCCMNLMVVHLGKNVRTLDFGAFGGCCNLKSISLPDSVRNINAGCFSFTDISALIIPSGVSVISNESFGDEETNKDHEYRRTTCVFEGYDTQIKVEKNDDTFFNVDLIYCQLGSHAHEFAQKHYIPVKPLSEFKPEEYGL